MTNYNLMPDVRSPAIAETLMRNQPKGAYFLWQPDPLTLILTYMSLQSKQVVHNQIIWKNGRVWFKQNSNAKTKGLKKLLASRAYLDQEFKMESSVESFPVLDIIERECSNDNNNQQQNDDETNNSAQSAFDAADATAWSGRPQHINIDDVIEIKHGQFDTPTSKPYAILSIIPVIGILLCIIGYIVLCVKVPVKNITEREHLLKSEASLLGSEIVSYGLESLRESTQNGIPAEQCVSAANAWHAKALKMTNVIQPLIDETGIHEYLFPASRLIVSLWSCVVVMVILGRPSPGSKIHGTPQSRKFNEVLKTAWNVGLFIAIVGTLHMGYSMYCALWTVGTPIQVLTHEIHTVRNEALSMTPETIDNCRQAWLHVSDNFVAVPQYATTTSLPTSLLSLMTFSGLFKMEVLNRGDYLMHTGEIYEGPSVVVFQKHSQLVQNLVPALGGMLVTLIVFTTIRSLIEDFLISRKKKRAKAAKKKKN